MSRTPSRQVVALDVMRVVAALAVAIYHFGFFHLTPVDQTLVDYVPQSFAKATMPLTHFGWVGVEIFFLISGYVIAFSSQSATPFQFAKSRILRLVPAVWLCAPLTAFIYFCLGQSLGQLLPRLARTLTFFPLFSAVDGVYWTLGIEVSFYALVFVAMAAGWKNGLERIAIGLAAFSFAFWIAYWCLNAVIPDQGTARFLLNKVPAFRIFQLMLFQHGAYFAGGIYLRLCQDNGVKPRYLLGFAVVVTAAMMEMVAQNNMISQISKIALPIYPAIATWLFALALMAVGLRFNGWVTSHVKGWAGVIRSLGLATYPFYLLHNPVGLAVMALVSERIHPAFALAMALATTALLSISIAHWVEPPIRRALRDVVSSAWKRHQVSGS